MYDPAMVAMRKQVMDLQFRRRWLLYYINSEQEWQSQRICEGMRLNSQENLALEAGIITSANELRALNQELATLEYTLATQETQHVEFA